MFFKKILNKLRMCLQKIKRKLFRYTNHLFSALFFYYLENSLCVSNNFVKTNTRSSFRRPVWKFHILTNNLGSKLHTKHNIVRSTTTTHVFDKWKWPTEYIFCILWIRILHIGLWFNKKCKIICKIFNEFHEF